MPATIKCLNCEKEFTVIPARESTAKFCSTTCKGEWMTANLAGTNHPRWTGGERYKTCAECGESFTLRPGQPITTFRGQYHSRWADAVIARDKATCQPCGIQGVELQAHHIKSYRDYPELRDDVSNGLTLCAPCHWQVHTANGAKGVNSGKLLPGNAGDNPEPSQHGNVMEGVTTNGRAYRRWVGECVWCGTFITKRLSDATGKRWLACSYSCSSKHSQKLRGHGSNADTSAPPVKG